MQEMITKYNIIDELASQIDVELLGACGATRIMPYRNDDDNDPVEEARREETRHPQVTAVLIAQVRRDIVNMTSEMRRGFNDLSDRVRDLELKNAESKGTLAGVKGTMVFIVTLSTLLGGLVGWVVSLFTKSTVK